MAYHDNKKMSNPGKKKMSKMEMDKLSDAEYYKEHKKHHSDKHIKAMKQLQKKGMNRNKAHDFVKKYL
jgi:predicted metal-dependent HD superfamily phosphohydrolase